MQRSGTKDGVSSKIVVKTGKLTGFGESKVVSGAIGNTPCDFIIDTWSNITILHPDSILRPTFLRTVIGESVPVRGKTTVKMRLVQHNCQVDVGNARLNVEPDGTDEEGKRQ